MKTKHLFVSTFALFALIVSQSKGAIIFQENFESTAGTSVPAGWMVDSGKFGITTANPLVAGIDTSSRVFSFSAPTESNDSFSSLFDLSPYKGVGQVFLSFDFLSNATNNHGGLIGLAEGNNAGTGSTGIWQAGSPASQPGASPVYSFSGNGAWESFSFDVTGYVNTRSTAQLLNTSMSFENWDDASVMGSTPVYFDNVKVSSVPEPSTSCLIFGIAATVLAIGYKRTRKSQTQFC